MISNEYISNTSLVKLAHKFVREKVKAGDIVIDATVGNGLDTVFLLDLVKSTGFVFGFDIQQQAIDTARIKLKQFLFSHSVTLINDSHANIIEHVPLNYQGNIAAVMFNLGYLPGGEKHIITQSDSTLAALSLALKLLLTNGIITILAYQGHVGGKTETEAVENWLLSLDPKQYKVDRYTGKPNNPLTPLLFVVYKSS